MIRGLPRVALVRVGREAWLELFPGSAIAVLVGMAAAFLGGHYKGSMLLFALLLGMALNFLIEDPRLRPGIQFVAGTVLRLGVALLGLRLTLDNVSSPGFGMVAALVTGVMVTVLVNLILAGALGLDRDLALLVGGATAWLAAGAAAYPGDRNVGSHRGRVSPHLALTRTEPAR